MTNMPEKIWAWPDDPPFSKLSGGWSAEDSVGAVSYTRTDSTAAHAHRGNITFEITVRDETGVYPSLEAWCEAWRQYALPVAPSTAQSIIVPKAVWDVLPKWVGWIAADANKEICAYPSEPILGEFGWIVFGGYAINITHLVGVQRGTVGWRESLIRRPEGV